MLGQPVQDDNIYELPIDTEKLQNSVDLILMGNEMFKNSEPMSGRELHVLRKTSKRLISDKPTTLNKK